MDTLQIAQVITALVGLASFCLASYKAGYVIYYSDAFWSKDRPRHYIDKSKVAPFVTILVLSLLFFLGVFLLIGLDANTAFIYGSINTILASWALTYWILLDERANTKGNKAKKRVK